MDKLRAKNQQGGLTDEEKKELDTRAKCQWELDGTQLYEQTRLVMGATWVNLIIHAYSDALFMELENDAKPNGMTDALGMPLRPHNLNPSAEPSIPFSSAMGIHLTIVVTPILTPALTALVEYDNLPKRTPNPNCNWSNNYIFLTLTLTLTHLSIHIEILILTLTLTVS